MNLRNLALILLLGSCTYARADLTLYFDNLTANPNLNDNNIYVTFYVPTGTGTTVPQVFDGTVNGSGPMSGAINMTSGELYQTNPTGTNVITHYNTAGLNISQSYTLAELSQGVTLTKAISTNFYITEGQPLATAYGQAGVPGQDGTGVLTFGVPSTVSGPSDPNFNVKWVAGEVTLTPTAGDYGDITAINAFNIPLQISNYQSTTATGTILQTIKTQNSITSPVLQQLEALAQANSANGLNGAPYTGYVGNGSVSGSATWTTTVSGTGANAGEFLRQVGPPSGPTGSTSTTGTTTTTFPSVIGPYPSYNTYVDAMAGITATGSITPTTTKISGSIAAGENYNFIASAAVQGSNTDASIILSGTTTFLGGLSGTQVLSSAPLQIIVAPDTKVGTKNANYTLSNFIYASALTSPSLTLTVNGTATTLANFQNAAGSAAIVDQVVHDITAGYNFGLVGNTQTINDMSITGTVTPVSLNDIGSAGWTAIESLKGTAPLTGDLANILFTNKGNGSQAFYNQWAAILYNSSSSVYGFNYSDYLQSIALFSDQVPAAYSNTGTTTSVGSWMVDIMPDALVPEPGAWPLLACICVLFSGRLFLSSRRQNALRVSARLPSPPSA